MTLEEIRKKLDAAGVKYTQKGDRLYVRQTPCGGYCDYGYLVEGDDGSTGSCREIKRRAGEIKTILRRGKIENPSGNPETHI